MNWKKNKRFLTMGAILLFAGGVGTLLLYFPVPFFTLRETVVPRPLKTLSEEALLQLGGVKKGQNLLTLSLAKVKGRLQEHRWIRNVRLTKSFPGRLIVEVEEETPVALVALEGSLYFVNRGGELFKKMAPRDPKDFPVITGLPRSDFDKKGGEISERLRQLAALIDLFGGIRSTHSLGLSELHWNEGGGLTLFTVRPALEVVLGRDQWNEKLERLDRILNSTLEARLSELERIDLNFERRVVLKTKI